MNKKKGENVTVACCSEQNDIAANLNKLKVKT